MSESQRGKDSEKKKMKKLSKSDRKEKPSTDELPFVHRDDFPSQADKIGAWKENLRISFATDDGEDLPHGLRKPEIQACFLKEGYSSYQDIPPILGLQLLQLPDGDEEWARTNKIWQYCTGIPPPHANRIGQSGKPYTRRRSRRRIK